VSIKRRIERLERRPDLLPVKPSPHVVEMQELTRRIAQLDAEIAEIESKMTPEELERSREENAELNRQIHEKMMLGGFDAAIEWLDREIQISEQELEGEGGDTY